MSVYIIDNNHIDYLVNSAIDVSMRMMLRKTIFNWRHNGKLQFLSVANATEVGRMLREENVRSATHRYVDLPVDDLPELYVFDPMRRINWFSWNAAQVLKAAHCYEYQSCEHPGWKSSSARAMMKELRSSTEHLVMGYAEVIWGAPQPIEEVDQWVGIDSSPTQVWYLPRELREVVGVDYFHVATGPGGKWQASSVRSNADVRSPTVIAPTVILGQFEDLNDAREACVAHLSKALEEPAAGDSITDVDEPSGW